MSEPCQAPQIPVKQDQRKVMTEEKLERLAKARQVRAANRIAKEEKRMELAKQMILASVTRGPGMSTQTIKMLDEKKTSAEEKKLKWEARKDELMSELWKKIGEANVLAMKKAKEPEPVPEPESESEFLDMEEPPAKRPKKEKKKSKTAAVPKPSKTKKAKRPSSSMAVNTYERDAKRKVKPAAVSESESESTEDESSEVEQENVLRLW